MEEEKDYSSLETFIRFVAAFSDGSTGMLE